MFDISCSIVLYNTPIENLKKSVKSFLNCTLNTKLYLVDNSPTDELRNYVNAPNIEYIHTKKNIGYGAGNNIAIRKSIDQAKYHLVLNPDVEFDPKTLEGLFKFMELHSNVGLLMPKVLYENGDTQHLCKKLPAPADLFLRRFIPEKIKNHLKSYLDEYELKHLDYNSTMQVPNLSGCFMFMRTSTLYQSGIFDEQYFLYLEDTDLCRRINECALTVYYPQEKIYHCYNKASYRNLKLLMYHLDSTIKYFNKWGWMNDKRRNEINRSLRNRKRISNLSDFELVSNLSY